MLRYYLTAISAAAMCGALVQAEPTRQWTPFVIPADVHPQSLIAMRATPIAVDSPRVVVKDGHFFAGEQRLRIWGVNLSYGACFPTHDDAARVARRLEAFGVNSVRFHHMDMAYFRFPRSIWDPTDPRKLRDDPRKLSDEALDRLDYFIEQLARRGIYANINLHVSALHSQQLNLPDSRATGNYDKIVDLFTPQLIEAQWHYARQLLTRVNRYRNVRYADDPAVAFVEINNEESFFIWSAETKMPEMHPFYMDVLTGRFNQWLKARYATTSEVAEVWRAQQGPAGRTDPMKCPMSGAETKWKLSALQGAQARLDMIESNAARVNVQHAGAAAWHVELHHAGLRLERDRQYELTLRARGDAQRDAVVTVRQGHAQWQTLGLRQTLKLTPQWQTFTLPFHTPQDEADARLSLLLGQSTTSIEITDVALSVKPLVGLAENEQLDDASIKLFVSGESRPRLIDRMRFLAETEKSYFDDFRRYIREELRSDALVTGTMAYGPLGLWAQSDMDYIDTHTYWAHPQFPAGWSDSNWTIEQKSLIDHHEEAKLFHDAATRLAGKPFTVSEFSHPTPNDYQAEGIPLVAAVAAAQDWDGVWMFGYADDTDWDADAINGFFNMHAHPGKWGFMPAGAAIFRDGGIEPLSSGGAWPLVGGEDDAVGGLIDLHLKHGLSMIDALHERWGLSRQAVLRQRVAVIFAGQPAALPASPDSGTRIDLESGRFSASGRSGRVQIQTAGQADALAEDAGFAVLTATAMDGVPLDDSSKVLFTLAGRCENTDMGFSSDRRTVGTRWGGGPVRIEAMAAKVYWPWRPTLQLTAIGTSGEATDVIPRAEDPQHPAALPFSPQYHTMWYLLQSADPAK